ncbi:MAG: RDD family protein [Halanaerobiaceae bacterium]
MNKTKVTTPENIEVEYTLAGLGSRTAAVLVDTLIQGVFILGISLVMYFMRGLAFSYYEWVIAAAILIIALIIYGYYIIMELNMNGRTPGKKLVNLRVVRSNGRPVTLKHSAIRNLFRVLIDMPGLGPILMFFRDDHRRIGDLVASTMVIVEEEKSQPPALDEELRQLLSEAEYRFLGEYLNRREQIDDATILAVRAREYFQDKFAPEEMPQELDRLLGNS